MNEVEWAAKPEVAGVSPHHIDEYPVEVVEGRLARHRGKSFVVDAHRAGGLDERDDLTCRNVIKRVKNNRNLNRPDLLAAKTMILLNEISCILQEHAKLRKRSISPSLTTMTCWEGRL